MAAAAAVLPIPISPTQIASSPATTSAMPTAMAAAHSASLIAAVWEKSAVGRRSLIGVTPQFAALSPAELVDGRAAGLEIGHHLARHLGWKGRHALGGDAVIAGEDQHPDVIQCRRMTALPGRQPFGNFLQPAQRTGRFGQVWLTQSGLLGGLGIGGGQIPQQGADLIEGGDGR